MSALECLGGGFHIEPFLNILNSSVLQVENVSPFDGIKCYSTVLKSYSILFYNIYLLANGLYDLEKCINKGPVVM